MLNYLCKDGKSLTVFIRRCSQFKSSLSSLIDVSKEITDALLLKKPIVALESTIITHGMPYPQNFETALAVEEIIRHEDAIPATIAILNGRLKVGLSKNDLQRLASPETSAVKTSRRDMAYILSKSGNGGTTVAGTLIVANLLGIPVFATGGLGGVHRDGHNTMDVSADLIEMGRSAVAVVSSGVKSILDIPRTLEVLETQGVCVASYQSPECDFPAFYTRRSGEKAYYNFNTPQEAAKMIHISLKLGLKSGILIGVPIPNEHAMSENEINKAIEEALQVAATNGISGKDVTPFLLRAISNLTKGRSLESNKALIKNNAKVGAQIAVQLSQLQRKECHQAFNVQAVNPLEQYPKKIPTVIGGSIVDACFTLLDNNIAMNGATYKSKLRISAGGVGRNIAEGIYKLHGGVQLISAVGNDQNGQFIRAGLPVSSTQASVVTDAAKSTAMCSVILDAGGDCKFVVGDMQVHSAITPDLIRKNENIIANSPLIVMDANIPIETMEAILTLSKKHKRPVFFEPTDMLIASKPFELSKDLTSTIKFISPNIFELNAIAHKLDASVEKKECKIDFKQPEIKEYAIEMCKTIISHFDTITVTLGSLGVLIARKRPKDVPFFTANCDYLNGNNGPGQYRFYPTKEIKNIVNVSGAGDSFTSGFITGMLAGCNENICVAIGVEAAHCALMSYGAVPDKYFEKTHKCWTGIN